MSANTSFEIVNYQIEIPADACKKLKVLRRSLITTNKQDKQQSRRIQSCNDKIDKCYLIKSKNKRSRIANRNLGQTFNEANQQKKEKKTISKKSRKNGSNETSLNICKITVKNSFYGEKTSSTETESKKINEAFNMSETYLSDIYIHKENQPFLEDGNLTNKSLTGDDISIKFNNKQSKRIIILNSPEKLDSSIKKKTSNIFNKKDNITKRKYLKSSQIKQEDHKYLCKICGKVYINYPAFYTHKRNRHNIISISHRNNLFKSNNTNKRYSNTGKQENVYSSIKYNYNSISYGKFINFEFSDFLIRKMKETFGAIYKNRASFLYSEKLDIDSHVFLEFLEKYKIIFSNKIFIPPASLKLSIDEILIIYYILFSKVTNDEGLVETATIFIVYFREYLNIYGWFSFRYFLKFEVFGKLENEKIFTANNFIQFIPDFADNFINAFIRIPGIISIFQNDEQIENLENLCKNLCHWLFVNELSNLKLILNENSNNNNGISTKHY